jgi:hypothetical protein
LEERERERERERESYGNKLLLFILSMLYLYDVVTYATMKDIPIVFFKQYRQTGKYIEIEGKHDILISDKPKHINNKINMNTKDNLNIRLSEDKQENVNDTKGVIKNRNLKYR